MCRDDHLTGYRREYARLARNYCELGATNESLAKFFDVTPATIVGWMAGVPEFATAVYRGRRFADAHVAASLHRCAIGFGQTVERVMVCRGEPLVVSYTKHHPPDPWACAYWLSNRRPEYWGGVMRGFRRRSRARLIVQGPMAGGLDESRTQENSWTAPRG